ncbi:hypothetical protein S1OALGB6SA_2404 [Olavius algarvensis spirochete endosymbiont]|nr:hypothetical protein S1OALGB6SA_2404 [Olavius algarvensis spirochete endosymbiont]
MCILPIAWAKDAAKPPDGSFESYKECAAKLQVELEDSQLKRGAAALAVP